MALHGIPTTEGKLLISLMSDFPVSHMDVYNKIMCDGWYNDGSIFYFWWKFSIERGHISIDLNMPDYDDFYETLEELVSNHLSDDGYGRYFEDVHLKRAIPFFHPVLTKVDYESGQDYWGEHWERTECEFLFTEPDDGVHFFPMIAYDSETRIKRKITVI